MRRRSTVLGGDLLALGCLALNACPQKRQSKAVEEGLATGRAELCRRFARVRKPTIDRPFFNPYSRRDEHDYIFLNPELLAALALMECVDSEPHVRAFVLSVVKRLVDQITSANRDSGEPQGFRVQSDMLGTVDQMWAIRVLYAFHRTYQRNPSGLRPPGSLVLRSGVIAVPLVLALIVGSILLFGTAGATIAAVLSALLGAILNPFVRRED
jgi:hypothetical protein